MICKRKILFITQFSLSGRTAIGIQTSLLINDFSDWIHLYWEPEKMRVSMPRSHQLENRLPTLWPFSRGRGFYRRAINKFGLTWWRDNKLKAKHRLGVSKIIEVVEACYMAPLDEAGATRCRDLIELVDCPFVVHLWDILRGSLADEASDLRWLVQHAEHVFCVSKSLLDEASVVNPNVSYLLFGRPASKCFATAPTGGALRIALIGHLNSYQAGLGLLFQAVQRLKTEGMDAKIIYVGQKAGLYSLPDDIRSSIESIGFLSDAQRDAVLADCHVAFMPGPLKPPGEDGRSKYSIPSRLLDFFSVGLPVIATIHPDSATALFLKDPATKGVFLASRDTEICAAIRALKDEGSWQRASNASLNFFESEFRASDKSQKLARHFAALRAACAPRCSSSTLSTGVRKISS